MTGRRRRTALLLCVVASIFPSAQRLQQAPLSQKFSVENGSGWRPSHKKGRGGGSRRALKHRGLCAQLLAGSLGDRLLFARLLLLLLRQILAGLLVDCLH